MTEVATARPGVLRMMDAALDRTDIAAGICSAATRGGFDQVVNSVVGTDRLERLDVVMAGDDVPRKKPDPIIYSEFAPLRLGFGVEGLGFTPLHLCVCTPIWGSPPKKNRVAESDEA